MKKELVCIGCPMGCYLAVDYEEATVSGVGGNRCKVGLEYAQKEIANPERTLTTTVAVKNGVVPLVSVRTSKPIPKSRLFDAMDLLAKVEAEAPIHIGEPVIRDLFGSGVDVIATKSVLKNVK